MALSITDDLLKADRNNFTLVRWVLASAVIYTHAVRLLGYEDATFPIFLQPISWLAVNGFFTLSGFLMYRSLERNPSITYFAVSRFMRIWPGMFFMCAIVTVTFAAFTTVSLREYFLGRETMEFLVYNQFLLPSYNLTGVYCNELSGNLCAINGSLWTIRWEVSCYAAIAVVSAVGLLRYRRFNLLVFPLIILFSLFYQYPPAHQWFGRLSAGELYFLDQITRLWVAFAIGAAIYGARHWIKLSWVGIVLTFVAAYLSRSYFFGELVLALAVAYWVFCGGFMSARALPWAHKIPDYSFGIYIYSMPVTDVYRMFFPGIDPHLLVVVTFISVIPFAAFSWHVIEKPAQELRKRFRRPRFLRRRVEGPTTL